MTTDDGHPLLWLSAHVFFPADIYSPAADRVILELLPGFLVGSQAAGAIRSQFFVRYSERGPHIRVRLAVPPQYCLPTADLFLEHVARLAPGATLDRWTPSRDNRPGSDVGPVLERPTRQTAVSAGDIVAVKWVPYEPECDRYGGPDAIHIAENVFSASSDLVLRVLADSSGDSAQRLGRALLATVVTVHAFLGDRSEAEQLAHRYGMGYLRALTRQTAAQQLLDRAFHRAFEAQAATLASYVAEAWDSLDAGIAVPMYETFAHQMRQAREHLLTLWRQGRLGAGTASRPSWQLCLRRLLPSYLHMTCNRLGVPMADESYLGLALAWSLSRLEQQREQVDGHAALEPA